MWETESCWPWCWHCRSGGTSSRCSGRSSWAVLMSPSPTVRSLKKSSPSLFLTSSHLFSTFFVGVVTWQLEERVWEVKCPGPIPPSNRLFIQDPVCSEAQQLGHSSQPAWHPRCSCTLHLCRQPFWWPSIYPLVCLDLCPFRSTAGHISRSTCLPPFTGHTVIL